MGLSLAKMYNDKFYTEDRIRPEKDSTINVLYNGSEFTLETSLNLPCETPLSLIYLKNDTPSIILKYDSDDEVVFSLRGNRLHFIILKADKNRGKEAHTSYPWLSNLDGIRVSRITREEYKDAKLYNLMEFRD
jgi:hypothetical protein